MPNAIVRANAVALPKDRRTAANRPDFDPGADFVDDPSTFPDHYLVRVHGDCLAPVIRDGDLAVIDKSEPCRRGDLVVVYRTRDATPAGECQAIIKQLAMEPPPWVTYFPHFDRPGSALAAAVVLATTAPPQCFGLYCRDILAMYRCVGTRAPEAPPLPPHPASAAWAAAESR